MKTISICLEDSVYDELIKMLKEKGQSPQSFFEKSARSLGGGKKKCEPDGTLGKRRKGRVEKPSRENQPEV